MNSASRKFLYSLLETPSPSGFEQQIQKIVKKRMQEFADIIESDLHGNLIVGINSKAQRRVMLAGHCDQIGMMVRHITEQGFIYFGCLGGIDAGTLPGSRVTIYNTKGTVPGVIGRKPIHLQKQAERQHAELDSNSLWIDIGAANRKAAERLVSIGDAITFELGVIELGANLISSPGLDDRVGLFVVMEALRLCSRAKLNVALYAVSTVQEELGLRGATTSAEYLTPEIGIAVDVTHAYDNPAIDDDKLEPCSLGKGPTICRGPNVNPVVEKRLLAAARSAKIPFQLSPSAELLRNDARAIQIAGRGVAAASIGIPNRYMHSQVEVCDLRDIENAARLLAEFVKGIGSRTDFRPV